MRRERRKQRILFVKSESKKKVKGPDNTRKRVLPRNPKDPARERRGSA